MALGGYEYLGIDLKLNDVSKANSYTQLMLMLCVFSMIHDYKVNVFLYTPLSNITTALLTYKSQ
jgi:hypothetical protein